MEIPSNTNSYELAVRETEALFSSYIEGAKSPLFCVISALPLGDAPRGALQNTANVLGYGASLAFISLSGSGAAASPLDAAALFMLLEGLDPRCVVVADMAAAQVFSDAYRMPVPLGVSCRVFGRSVAAFPDFSGALESQESKQLAWKVLRQLPACGTIENAAVHKRRI